MSRAIVYPLLALVLAFSGYKAWQVYDMGRMGPAERARVASAQAIEGRFQLTDHTGRQVTESSFGDKRTLVFFGYTFCPDVCPTALQDVSDVMDMLGPDAERLVPVFITVDPARDTVEVLKEYVSNFHPATVGLTGSPAAIQAAARSFHAYYAKAVTDESDPESYLMSHSARLYLMGPKGLIRHFQYGTKPTEMAAMIRPALRP